MPRGYEVTLSFPPFTRTMKWLVFGNAAIFLLTLLAGFASPRLAASFVYTFGLVPGLVVKGWIWQLVTYAFLHGGFFHLLYNMLILWMFGTDLELAWGRRRFLDLYFLSLTGAAAVTVLMALAGVLVSMQAPTIGASGGVYGILGAFATIYGDRRIIILPIPIPLKARYWVGFLVVISVIGALQERSGIAHLAHLGGLLFGVLYARQLMRGRISGGLSEAWYGLRNAWHRWRRRQAARQFEVYMRDYERKSAHDQDSDAPPPGKGNGEHRGPWVH
ncbi:MAG TPA: rhomboid family intramembrane serine protease [Terriglobales bacterium]|nr:rhomboid family intramembrane serine protease [Terriglobales bacterium]